MLAADLCLLGNQARLNSDPRGGEGETRNFACNKPNYLVTGHLSSFDLWETSACNINEYENTLIFI